MADITEKSLEVLQKMSDVLDGMSKSKEQSEELHTKTPANFHTGDRLHGWNGIFSTSGIERDVVSSHMRPMGIGSILPLLPTIDENPMYATLTGFQEYAGSEPTNVCEDAPSGYMKGALLTARFGRVRRDTDTIDMTQVIRRINRGEMTDLTLRGQLLGLSGLSPEMDQSGVLDIVTKSEMITAAVMAERRLLTMMWQGVYGVANEFPGLDVQIATGQVDAETGTAAPALDSDVKDFNYVSVANTAIVEYIATMEHYLSHIDSRTGVGPVERVIVMRPDLWQEITAVWPLAYHTQKGSMITGLNSTIFLDGRVNVDERDAMRQGLYLDVNGKRYRVILDDGIFEKTNITTAGLDPGQYASSIYFVPLSIAGGMPVTYRQYLDYRKAQPNVSLLGGKEDFFWTDNGVFTWAIEQVKWCYKISLLTEQRVVLRTPQLAGRIDNVMYEPLQHLRDFSPSSPYFKDGGVSLRTSQVEPYAVWSSRS
jgi:hypothetical protein